MQVQKAKNNSKTEYEFKPGGSLNFKAEYIENKILSRFTFLQQEGVLHKITCSYDFRENEKNMLDTWEKIIDFLLSDIFNCCAITMSDLKKYTVIKNRIPLGLNNIIQQLRIEQKYITEEDLKDNKFYQFNFPELYPPEKGYFSNFIGGIKSIINIAGKIGCKEENDSNEQDIPIRTDISYDDKYKNIPENSIIFNYQKFKNHCNQFLLVLSDILKEKDEEEVISIDNLTKTINEKYIEKEGKTGGLISLPYGVQYIDHVLYYLMKIKKIALFDIELNNKKIKYVKLLKNTDDTITEKDQAISKLLSHCELLEKRINEYQKKIDHLRNEAKNLLKMKNKEGAKTILIKMKNYEKFLQNSQNTQNVLEDQIFALKNAQNNASVTEILKQCLDAGKEIKMNADEFAEVTEDLKEQKDNLNEINIGMSEFITDNEDELNNEMAQLEIENKNENENEKKEDIKFPNANNEIIDENKIFEDLVK
jgi:phage shock protein A